MYDWLDDALRESSVVVTANRRLARVLTAAHSQHQIAAGHLAWQSPHIVAWPDWLADLVTKASAHAELPIRINANQSRVLWERCLRREIADPLLNVSMLARQAEDAWQRLHDWCLPLTTCAAAAIGRDQKIFASAAKSYQSILDGEAWVDQAGISALLQAQLPVLREHLPAAITIAGFDRVTPAAEQLLAALKESGVAVDTATPEPSAMRGHVVAYEDADAELRAAGAWARSRLQADPEQQIGIVQIGLERSADRSTRLVLEGIAPAWQTGGAAHRSAVNVSYGRRLSEYPLIANGLLALQWCARDISSHELSRLLRVAAIGRSPVNGRSQLELLVRQMPARQWSPARALASIGNADHLADDAGDFLRRIELVATLRAELPRRATPSEWASRIDEMLTELNWPGDGDLDSRDFQLANRWRDLLNEFARLELVVPTLDLSQALARLRSLAADTVFQPESLGAAVPLLGPLEAAGMQFDALWVAGMSSANWPPAGRPSALLSRSLQREHQMPDAQPADTLAYAERVLSRLAASAGELVYSYARSDGDSEQAASPLLDQVADMAEQVPADPGWRAAELGKTTVVESVSKDPVPEIGKDEIVTGGASTIEKQFVEPFSAFAHGRLGIRPLYAIPQGLPPTLRGSLVHASLYHLYQKHGDQAALLALSDAALQEQLTAALRKAFARADTTSDEVLHELLQLEKQRVRQLLAAVVEMDRQRNVFAIAELEAEYESLIAGVPFKLRIDRVEKTAAGRLRLLDYKTGSVRHFLGSDAEPTDMQLVVYAMAVDEPVDELAFVNVDTRQVDIDGAGTTLTPDLDWPAWLQSWTSEVEAAVGEFAAGDVRLQPLRAAHAARALGLLSRIREIHSGE